MGTLKRFDLRREEEREKGLKAVTETIQCGRLMLFPTDTLYGIGANALNEKAVERVLEAKSRPADKPLLVLVSCWKSLNLLCASLSSWHKHCCERLWPGPVTLLLPARPGLPRAIVRQGKIGVRWPAGKLVGQILGAAGCPLVAPSANLSGEDSALTVDEALRALSSFVELVLDNGSCASASPSTVVDVQKDSLSVIRIGVMSEREIQEALQETPRNM